MQAIVQEVIRRSVKAQLSTSPDRLLAPPTVLDLYHRAMYATLCVVSGKLYTLTGIAPMTVVHSTDFAALMKALVPEARLVTVAHAANILGKLPQSTSYHVFTRLPAVQQIRFNYRPSSTARKLLDGDYKYTPDEMRTLLKRMMGHVIFTEDRVDDFLSIVAGVGIPSQEDPLVIRYDLAYQYPQMVTWVIQAVFQRLRDDGFYFITEKNAPNHSGPEQGLLHLSDAYMAILEDNVRYHIPVYDTNRKTLQWSTRNNTTN
jgi:hypothetical protein